MGLLGGDGAAIDLVDVALHVACDEYGVVESGTTLVPTSRPGSVTALLDVAARSPGVRARWLAPSASPADREALAASEVRRLRRRLGYCFEPVPVGEQAYRRHYDEAGARILWFAQHGLGAAGHGDRRANRPGRLARATGRPGRDHPRS